MPRPPARLLNPTAPWSPGLIPAWDIAASKNALLSHERGQFQSSSKMATAMGRDDRVTAVIETRVMGLLSLPFSMIPGDVPRGKVRARKIAEEIEAHWETIVPAGDLSAAMWWFILLGVAPVQIIWATIDGLWVPTIRAWDPQFMYWDESIDGYRINTKDGVMDVTPENGWLLLVQGERGWMRGAVRSITVAWLSRQFATRDWNRYNERHGMPLLKLKVPARATEDEKADFFRNMSQIGSSATASLPQGIEGAENSFDIELLEAKDRSWESFEGLEDRANTNIAVRILGQNLTTEVSSGALASTKIHDNIRLDRLQADAKLISSNIRDSLLKLMVRFNWGVDEIFTPTPHWDTEPPADLVAKGEAITKLGEGISALKVSGFGLTPNTIEELGQDYNLELVPIEASGEEGPVEGSQAPAPADQVVQEEREAS